MSEGERWLGSLFLLLAGTLVLAGAGGREARLRIACVGVVGFAFEVVGVRYGWPFGAYSYTDALPPALLGVPVVMAFAWMALAVYVRTLVRPMRLPGRAEALLGALWLTAIDLVIDPLAAGPLDYWRWPAGGFYYGVPLSNFAGWFVTGLVVFVVFDSRGDNPPARLVGLGITLFFTLLALAHAFYLPALLGLLLCLAHFATKKIYMDKQDEKD